jgi:hypothetical protein
MKIDLDNNWFNSYAFWRWKMRLEYESVENKMKI